MGKTARVKVHMVYSLQDLKRFVALAPEAACNAARDCVHVEEHLCRKQRNRTISESGTSAGRVQDLLYDNYGNDTCLVTSGCLWSTFTLHEMYLSLWQHLAKPPRTLSAAQRAAETLFQGNPYVALHWRLEGSKVTQRLGCASAHPMGHGPLHCAHWQRLLSACVSYTARSMCCWPPMAGTAASRSLWTTFETCLALGLLSCLSIAIIAHVLIGGQQTCLPLQPSPRWSSS